MTTKQEAAIRQHGELLLAIFPEAAERDPVTLCKKLRTLEGKAARIALRFCNGPEFDYPDQADRKIDGILDRVHQLLGLSDVPHAPISSTATRAATRSRFIRNGWMPHGGPGVGFRRIGAAMGSSRPRSTKTAANLTPWTISRGSPAPLTPVN